MKTAICYYSAHHHNTLKVIRAMTDGYDVDLIDVTKTDSVDLSGYDLVGFASGIYGFAPHEKVTQFAQQFLLPHTPTFFVYTYGLQKGTGTKPLQAAAAAADAVVLGEYGCKGYDTFGPVKLIGGTAKGHPNAQDLSEARAFFERIYQTVSAEKK